MKTHIKNLSVLPVLMLGGGLIPVGRVTAQIFTTLYHFTETSPSTTGVGSNSDGAFPNESILLSNKLYGTAQSGGSAGWGTVFAVNIDGTGFTVVHTFINGNDGAYPLAGLTSFASTLYGTAGYGGSSGGGTVFKVNTDGTALTTLHSFTGTNRDGAFPASGLCLSSNTLYGATYYGGTAGIGTLFEVNTDGTAFRTLHSFTAGSGVFPYITNSDGVYPQARLLLTNNILYGTAPYGGISGNGTVFKLNTDGTGFTVLHSFASMSDSGGNLTNIDGANPLAELVLAGETIYGAAPYGGISGNGTVFRLNTDGTGFAVLHSFGGLGDGVYPRAGLILSGNTLYGTTIGDAFYTGGYDGGGLFVLKTDGTCFATLYRFTGGARNESAHGLILSGNTLYGTSEVSRGGVFSISFPPQLTMMSSAGKFILAWPTNYAGFDYTGYTLQCTTNLGSPVWTPVHPASVPVNGQWSATHPITGTQQFFRLSQ